MVIVKNVVSGYIERWNFMLGAIFVAIVILMPEGLSARYGTAVAPGMGVLRGRLRRRGWSEKLRLEAMSALAVKHLWKSFGGLNVASDRSIFLVEPGERAPDHRAEWGRQDHAVQSHHRRAPPDRGAIHLFERDMTRAPTAGARISACAHLSDHHAVPEGHP